MTQRSEQWSETLVGAVVIAVAVGFFGLAMLRGGDATAGSGYALVARFDRVDGVAVGTDVRVSGVKVGTVSSITLDPVDYRARVEMAVDRRYEIPDDSIARIAAESLLGGNYVSVDVGASETMLADGGEFEQTQGSLDLLSLVSSFTQAQGGGGSSAAPGSGDGRGDDGFGDMQ